MDSPEPTNESNVRLPAEPAEALSAAACAPEALPPPGPAPEVFWGYADLCLFLFFGVLGLLAGAAVLKIESVVFHFTKAPVAALLPAQMVTYAVLFGGLQLMFHMQYDRPFWSSLGWKPFALPLPYVAAVGASTAVAAMLAGWLIRLPQKENQMSEVLSQGNMAVLLMALFGVAVAPLCEELAFRGLLQPLLSRSFGAPAGILLAGAAFGLLHFREYGDSWRHALVLSGAGACFGWMRHATKSTKASVIMHASYNGLLFLLLAIAMFSERNQHH